MTDYSTLAPKTKWSKLPDALLLRVFGDDPNIIRLGAYRQSQAPDALAAIVTIDLYTRTLPAKTSRNRWIQRVLTDAMDRRIGQDDYAGPR